MKELDRVELMGELRAFMKAHSLTERTAASIEKKMDAICKKLYKMTFEEWMYSDE